MKAKTRQEIAREFGISRRTLYRWLKKAELTLPSGLVSPRNQLRIYDKIGYPSPKRELSYFEKYAVREDEKRYTY